MQKPNFLQFSVHFYFIDIPKIQNNLEIGPVKNILVDINNDTDYFMSSYSSCVVEIQICGGSQTWPWYVPELANGTFVVVSGNEGDSKLEQMGGELSVSEWQLPTCQLSGAALLTSSLGSPTSVSVIHYLPTRPGSVPPMHSCCQPWRNLAIFDSWCFHQILMEVAG